MENSVEDHPLPPVIPVSIEVTTALQGGQDEESEQNDALVILQHPSAAVFTPHEMQQTHPELDPDWSVLQELVFSPPRTPTAQNAAFPDGRSSRTTRRSVFFDLESVSSTDTRSDTGRGGRVVVAQRGSTIWDSAPIHRLPLEILQYLCDCYISPKAHFKLRLVSHRFDYFVTRNCVLWKRYTPDYASTDDPLVKDCLLRQKRLPSAAEILMAMDQRSSSQRSSDEQVTTPVAAFARELPGSIPVSETNSFRLNGPGIRYCFNGCAYNLWRQTMTADKARQFRKAQRHELRAIAAEAFASILFPTIGSNALSTFFALAFFGLLFTTVALVEFRGANSPLAILAIPLWFALVVAIPLGVMYLWESTLRRRILAGLCYTGLVSASILSFVFRGWDFGYDVPWSVCILPLLLSAIASAASEAQFAVVRGLFILRRLARERPEFVVPAKQSVPVPPRHFLLLNSLLTIATPVLFAAGLALFMLECDGYVEVAHSFNTTVHIFNATTGFNATHTRIQLKSPTPVYSSGVLWALGWIAASLKLGCVTLAFFSKHLRKYTDCAVLVVGHQVVFLCLAAISMILAFPADYFNFDQATSSGAVSLMDAVSGSSERSEHLFRAVIVLLGVYGGVTVVNTVSGKEKYYKTSIRGKYLPYFDSVQPRE